MIHLFFILLSSILLGCSSIHEAPLREGAVSGIVPTRQMTEIQTPAASYIVKSGDTLYSIAWEYQLDYRDLAAANQIPAPYHLHAGQEIQLKASNTTAVPVSTETTGVQTYAIAEPLPLASNISNAEPTIAATPHNTTSTHTTTSTQTTSTVAIPATTTTPAKTTSNATSSNLASSTTAQTTTAKTSNTHQSPIVNNAKITQWVWPAKGKVSRGFSQKNKGVDIQGQLGQPIYATAAGQVVYSGTGLRGYGQLIIIKHNADYLSAYAHNSVVLVAEGDQVKQGQKIAEMGDTGTNQVKLHFELRLKGKPVDPLKYLPSG